MAKLPKLFLDNADNSRYNPERFESMNKYNAVRTEVDGILFHSKGEAKRYGELKMLERAGEISDLELQPEFVLLDGFVRDGKRIQAIKYRADFKYLEDDIVVIEDFKGKETAEFRIKRKLFLNRYPEYEFRVTK